MHSTFALKFASLTEMSQIKLKKSQFLRNFVV